MFTSNAVTTRRFKRTTLGLSAMLLLAGCGGAAKGPELGHVKGVVLLDGQPLADATVYFQPKGPVSSPSQALTGPDGSFELAFNRNRKGAIPGDHKVKISTARLVSDESGNETQLPERLPSRYHADSELTYTVKPGENEFEIQLDSKGAPRNRSASRSQPRS